MRSGSGKAMELPVINCPFRTAQGSCQHVDKIARFSIEVGTDACQVCCATYPDESERVHSASIRSSPIGSFIYHARQARAKAFPELAKKAKAIAATRVKRPIQGCEREPAPVVADPDDRMEICLDCDSWIGERCTEPCKCKNRPRPMAMDGADCPLGRWRRG